MPGLDRVEEDQSPCDQADEPRPQREVDDTIGTKKNPSMVSSTELDNFDTDQWYATWRWLSRVVAKTAKGSQDYAAYLNDVSDKTTDERLLALLRAIAEECPDAYRHMPTNARNAIRDARPLAKPLRVNDRPIGSEAYARMNIIV